jgi:hypothetical protein
MLPSRRRAWDGGQFQAAPSEPVVQLFEDELRWRMASPVASSRWVSLKRLANDPLVLLIRQALLLVMSARIDAGRYESS